MFGKNEEIKNTELATQETENTEEVKVSMKEKAINAGKKVLGFAKKAAPWVLGAAGGIAATVAAFKLSGNSSDDDDEYEDDEYYEDDSSDSEE